MSFCPALEVASIPSLGTKAAAEAMREAMMEALNIMVIKSIVQYSGTMCDNEKMNKREK